MQRKCQQLMISPPPMQQGQGVSLRTIHLCCCPFLGRTKFSFLKPSIQSKHLIGPDNLWVTGWVAKGFPISRITKCHEQLNSEQSEPSRKWKQNMNLSFISPSQPDSPAYLRHWFTSPCLLLPTKNYNCKLCSNHFTVLTSNLSRQAGRQSTWVELLWIFVSFFVRLHLYWIFHWQTYI